MCGELRPSGHGADRRPQSGPAQPRTGTALARSGLDMCRLCHVLLLGLLAVESKSTWVLKLTNGQLRHRLTVAPAPLGTV